MIEVRTTERKTFKTCQQQWAWSVKEGLARRREATPLWFGTAVHVALAEWYQKGTKRGPLPAETFEKVLDGGDRSIRVPSDSEEYEAEYVDARILGVRMLQHYIDHYGFDESWEVIATEKTGHIFLPRLGANTRGKDIKYFYTFDGVYRDLETGEIWLMEHKTAKAIRTDHLPLDTQASAYWAVAEGSLHRQNMIKPNEHVEGIMFNFLRKKELDLRPKNEHGAYTNKPKKEHYEAAFLDAGIDITVWRMMKMSEMAELARKVGIVVRGDESKAQPLPYFERFPVFRSPEERKTQLQRIQEDAWHIERAWNDPGYPITKNPGDHCGWCPFANMCQLHESGDLESVEDMKSALYIHRDPYLAYRKSA